MSLTERIGKIGGFNHTRGGFTMRNPLSGLHRASSPAALLISLLALVIATSAGSAYAATKIGTSQIKKGAVTTPKLKKQAVTSGKIKEGAITSAKIRDGGVQVKDIAPAARAALRGTPPYPGSIYMARTDVDGTLTQAVGFTASERLYTGRYLLTATRPLDQCALIATPNMNSSAAWTTSTRQGTGNGLIVMLTKDGAPSNGAFSVVAYC